MAEVDIQVINTETNYTHTGDTNYSTTASIPSSSIQAADYLVIGNALVGGNNTTAGNFKGRWREATTDLNTSLIQLSMESGWEGTNNGWNHPIVDKHTFSGSSNFLHAHAIDATTTDTVHTTRVTALLIKVDDTDTASDALHSGDYEFAQDQTQINATGDGSTWDDLQSVTIGNGSDDYLVICTAIQRTGSFSASFDYRINVGGTPAEELHLKRNDTNTYQRHMIMTFLSAPASSTTVTAQFRSDSTLGDVQGNAILAIRLNAFDDYAGILDTTDTAITAADTDFPGSTLTHTTSHSSGSTEDWVFLGWSQVAHGDNSKRLETWLDQAGVQISGGRSNTYTRVYDNASPYPTSGHFLCAVQNMANSTDVDVEFGFQEESDVTPNPVIENTTIIGFTKQKASAATTPLLLIAANNAGF